MLKNFVARDRTTDRKAYGLGQNSPVSIRPRVPVCQRIPRDVSHHSDKNGNYDQGKPFYSSENIFFPRICQPVREPGGEQLCHG